MEFDCPRIAMPHFGSYRDAGAPIFILNSNGDAEVTVGEFLGFFDKHHVGFPHCCTSDRFGV